MRIFIVTKRQYMGKDLLDDRFGRFRELSLELARLGHELRGLTLSYRPRTEGTFVDEDRSDGACVTWDSVNLLNGCLPRLLRYTRRAMKVSQGFRPDVVWACSDAFHAIVGNWLANRLGCQSVIDLYDNFEAFRASRVPGILPLFRSAVRAADGVTAFSQRLASDVKKTYMRRKPTSVIESGTRKEFFYPQDRGTCRQRLGLPENSRIIGTAGALDGSRGIDTLFDAFERLSHGSDEIHLALAGPRQRRLRIPQGSRVHDFMELPHEEVGRFINALDIAVICYRESAQGEFSFPQKAYEIMACRVPMVAAAVGSMNEVLQNYPSCLYQPEDPVSLANAISRQLQTKALVEGPVPSWADSGKLLSDFFAEVVNKAPLSVTPDAEPAATH